MDGIGIERRTCGAIALKDNQVCALPFGRQEELARAIAALQHNLHGFLSRDIERE